MESYNAKASSYLKYKTSTANITKAYYTTQSRTARQYLEKLQTGQKRKMLYDDCSKILKRKRLCVDSTSNTANMINIYYDPEGDLFEIMFGKQTPSYYEELDDDISVRIDEKTGEIKGYMILGFSERGIFSKYFPMAAEHSDQPASKEVQKNP